MCCLTFTDTIKPKPTEAVSSVPTLINAHMKAGNVHRRRDCAGMQVRIKQNMLACGDIEKYTN